MCGGRLGTHGEPRSHGHSTGAETGERWSVIANEVSNRSKNVAGHRTIPLNDDSLGALSLLRERAELPGGGQSDHFVFPACENSQFDFTRHQKSWRTAWRTLTEVAGLKGFWFHDLRHQAITELSEAGASNATLQGSGQSPLAQDAAHYSHVRMEAKKELLRHWERARINAKP
jgi:integrase